MRYRFEWSVGIVAVATLTLIVLAHMRMARIYPLVVHSAHVQSAGLIGSETGSVEITSSAVKNMGTEVGVICLLNRNCTCHPVLVNGREWQEGDVAELSPESVTRIALPLGSTVVEPGNTVATATFRLEYPEQQDRTITISRVMTGVKDIAVTPAAYFLYVDQREASRSTVEIALPKGHRPAGLAIDCTPELEFRVDSEWREESLSNMSMWVRSFSVSPKEDTAAPSVWSTLSIRVPVKSDDDSGQRILQANQRIQLKRSRGISYPGQLNALAGGNSLSFQIHANDDIPFLIDALEASHPSLRLTSRSKETSATHWVDVEFRDQPGELQNGNYIVVRTSHPYDSVVTIPVVP
jgi:hypothetical protein